MTDVLTSTASDICNDAAAIAGVADIQEGLDATSLAKCRRALNMLLKSKQVKEFLWKLSDVTVTLTPGTQSYLVGPGGAGALSRVRPLRLSYCVRRTDDIDIEVPIISRQEYQLMPQKTQQGPVVNVYYDPQLNDGVLNVWYTGDTSNDTIICTFADPVDLFDTNSDTPDFPDEWIEIITYLLAARLCALFQLQIPQSVSAVVSDIYEKIENFDTDPGSIQFMPRSR